MTLYDIVWGMYNIVWGMYDNAWAMYDKNGWRAIACRGSESQVPSLIDQHWHRGIPVLHSSCALFQLLSAPGGIAGAVSWLLSAFRLLFSIFSLIDLLVTARLFLLSLVAPAFTKEPLLEITQRLKVTHWPVYSILMGFSLAPIIWGVGQIQKTIYRPNLKPPTSN